MKRNSAVRALTRPIAVAIVALVAASCATVKQDDFDMEMDRVRAEIREGDASVENRLGQRVDRLETQLSTLQSQLNDLRSEFDVTVERMETAIRFNTPVHFGFNEDRVQAEHRQVLDRLADVLTGYYADAVITVEGFTDPAGSAQYNMRLGQRRAEAVRDHLAGAGIPSSRMRAVSYGQSEERQIAPGAQGPGQAGWQNRRVAVVIDFSPQAQGRPVASSGS